MPTEELFGNYHFLLEVGGATIGVFQAVEGLSEGSAFTSEKIEAGSLKWKMASLKLGGTLKTYKVSPPTLKGSTTGTDQTTLNRMAGSGRAVSLALRGFRSERDGAATDWLARSTTAGRYRPGRIVLRDPRGEEVAAWNFSNAWPSKISGPTPKADGNDISFSDLVVTVEMLRRV
jgi:hypothetical protein